VHGLLPLSLLPPHHQWRPTQRSLHHLRQLHQQQQGHHQQQQQRRQQQQQRQR